VAALAAGVGVKVRVAGLVASGVRESGMMVAVAELVTGGVVAVPV
jgi:nicotinamide mononucleotide (NMN) deamidase PncC